MRIPGACPGGWSGLELTDTLLALSLIDDKTLTVVSLFSSPGFPKRDKIIFSLLKVWTGEQARLLSPMKESLLLGRRQANLCFHFAGSGENLPDIGKSRDATLDNKLLVLSSRF